MTSDEIRDGSSFERVPVQVNGSKTTVSIDYVLFQCIAAVIGSDDQARTWVKEKVNTLFNEPDFEKKKKTTGLSRMVQQKAYLLLLNK